MIFKKRRLQPKTSAKAALISEIFSDKYYLDALRNMAHTEKAYFTADAARFSTIAAKTAFCTGSIGLAETQAV